MLVNWRMGTEAPGLVSTYLQLHGGKRERERVRERAREKESERDREQSKKSGYN